VATQTQFLPPAPVFGARNLPAIVAVLRNVILHLERHDFSLAHPLSEMLLNDKMQALVAIRRDASSTLNVRLLRGAKYIRLRDRYSAMKEYNAALALLISAVD
jgi:hypothetical protein